MIIFDLDGTLADCEHRLHFVKEPETWIANEEFKNDPMISPVTINQKWREFIPDWKSFYEACDKDTVILPTWIVFRDILDTHSTKSVQIWSGRCESVREKTESWIMDNLSPLKKMKLKIELKMRPIGDYTPDDELKEKWIDEYINSNEWTKNVFERKGKCPIDFVFDCDPKSIEMWRRRGLFVFDCNQSGKEF